MKAAVLSIVAALARILPAVMSRGRLEVLEERSERILRTVGRLEGKIDSLPCRLEDLTPPCPVIESEV